MNESAKVLILLLGVQDIRESFGLFYRYQSTHTWKIVLVALAVRHGNCMMPERPQRWGLADNLIASRGILP